MSQSALFKTLNLFPPEKNLAAAERAKGSYGVLPYFLSKLLAELPMTAAYPLLFSAVLYPMAGLQPSVRALAGRHVGDVCGAICQPRCMHWVSRFGVDAAGSI